MTLKTRFFLVFALLVLLVISLFAATFFLIEQRAQWRQQRRAASDILSGVAAACREATLEGNWIAAVNQIKTAQADRAVLFSDCLDLSGRAKAHSIPEKIGRFVVSEEDAAGVEALEYRQYADEAGRTVWEAARPIELHGQKVGVARLAYDQALLEERIRLRLWDSVQKLLEVSSITFGLALAAALLMAWSLSRPIQSLVRATEEVKAGNLGYQSPAAQRKDELGRLAKAFNEMARHLSELEETKELFIGSITHDMKNPLTVIKGFLEVMLAFDNENLSAEQVKKIKTVEAYANRLALYADNLLDYSKLQVGTFPMTREDLEIGELIGQTAEVFSVPCQIDGVALEAHVAPKLPRVPADREMIQRVLANLLTNALKFTPEGGRITLRALKDPRGVLVCVEDTGPGIPPEAAGRIFEKFFQVEETRGLSRKKGTGLGLAICRQFVEQHGGRIWVESRPEAGAKFVFTLPMG